jgi:hypothetical protein
MDRGDLILIYKVSFAKALVGMNGKNGFLDSP